LDEAGLRSRNRANCWTIHGIENQTGGCHHDENSRRRQQRKQNPLEIATIATLKLVLSSEPTLLTG